MPEVVRKSHQFAEGERYGSNVAAGSCEPEDVPIVEKIADEVLVQHKSISEIAERMSRTHMMGWSMQERCDYWMGVLTALGPWLHRFLAPSAAVA